MKSGGNDFSGSAYYAYTGKALQSDNIGKHVNIIAPEQLLYRDDAFTVKVTNQINAANRLIGFVQPHYRNRTGGGSASADWSTATARVGFEGTWKGERQAVPTDRLVLSVLGGAWWLRSGDEDPGITTAPSASDSFLGTSFGSSSAIGGRNPQDRYVQDRWALGPKVTLNLGANIHRKSATINPGGFCRDAAEGPAAIIFPAQCYAEDSPPVWVGLAPRAHLSYDISGRSTTVIKGGYARYYTPLLEDDLHIANHYTISTISDAQYRWRDLNLNRNYDPGEVNLDPNGSDFLSLTLRGGDESYGFGHFNPDLEQRYHDELMLSFERQLAAAWAVRLSGVQSWARNQWRIRNVLRPYSAYNIPITNPDPGNDGILGSGDDPAGVTFTYFDYPAAFAGFANQDSEYVNDDSANRSYTSYEVELNRRYGNNWQFRASFSGTWKTEPFGTSDNTVIAGLDPNVEINSSYDRLLEWGFRTAASYLFPYGILASANFDRRSGEYWERTVQFRGPRGSRIPQQVLRVEPRGSRQADALNLLDVRAEKRFEIGAGRRLNVRLNVYNTLNANSPLGIQGRSGPQFGFVTRIPPGRILEGSLGFNF